MRIARLVAFVGGLAAFSSMAVAGDGAANNSYYLMDPAQCALDSTALEESDAYVLDNHGVGNHFVECRWDATLDFGAMVGKTQFISTTCQNSTATHTEEYSVTVPVHGIVAIKPVKAQRMPSTFYLCD